MVDELTQQSETQTVTDYLELARERFNAGINADKTDRQAAEEDNVFANAGDDDKAQWNPKMRANREDAGRPVLQWNRLPTYTAQVVNDGSRNDRTIKVSHDEQGTKETAEYLQARIRQIEYESNSQNAWSALREQQVTSGRAFGRVYTEFIPGTFRQRLCFEAIPNQFSVVWDPSAQRYDRKDAEWCFVVSLISKDEHLRRFGKKATQDAQAWTANCRLAPQWYGVGPTMDQIQIADYYWKEYRKRKLADMGGGVILWSDLVPEDMRQFIIAEREDEDCIIHIDTIDGVQKLEESEWIDNDGIPIVPLWGRMAVVNGQKRTYSLIRNAKDPQRLLNFYVSNIAEQIGQMPKTPFLVSFGSIRSAAENVWANASNTAQGFLDWVEYDDQGRQLSAPRREVNEPPIQAMTMAVQQCIDSIKASMGIFDASLGNRSNEVSGKAIRERQIEADITNYHFPFNEDQSRKRLGEIFVRGIAILDEEGGEYPVRYEDGKTQVIPVGKEFRDPKTGKQVKHDLTRGSYGVRVESGPNYGTARKQAHENLTQLVTAYPDLMNVVGDEVLRTDDFPGSGIMADRMRRFIDMKFPGLIETPDDEQVPSKPEDVMKIKQLEAQLQQMSAFAEQQFKENQDKQLDRDHETKIKEMDLNFKREDLQAKTVLESVKLQIDALSKQVTADLGALKVEVDSIKHTQTMAHAEQSAERSHEQALEMAEKQAELAPQPAVE